MQTIIHNLTHVNITSIVLAVEGLLWEILNEKVFLLRRPVAVAKIHKTQIYPSQEAPADEE
jgi:hypothetical protein